MATLTYRMSGGAEYSVYGSLKPVEEELKAYGLSIHRNYLVNQSHVSQIGKWTSLKMVWLFRWEGTEEKGKGEMMEHGRSAAASYVIDVLSTIMAVEYGPWF